MADIELRDAGQADKPFWADKLDLGDRYGVGTLPMLQGSPHGICIFQSSPDGCDHFMNIGLDRLEKAVEWARGKVA